MLRSHCPHTTTSTLKELMCKEVSHCENYAELLREELFQEASEGGFCDWYCSCLKLNIPLLVPLLRESEFLFCHRLYAKLYYPCLPCKLHVLLFSNSICSLHINITVKQAGLMVIKSKHLATKHFFFNVATLIFPIFI